MSINDFVGRHFYEEMYFEGMAPREFKFYKFISVHDNNTLICQLVKPKLNGDIWVPGDELYGNPTKLKITPIYGKGKKSNKILDWSLNCNIWDGKCKLYDSSWKLVKQERQYYLEQC